MIFKHFNLLNSRTVFDNIALPLELSGASKQQIADRVQSLLATTGLENKSGVYPSQLTNGQKQRVAIARALINQPKVLLCEEATAGLDTKTSHSILQLLSDINESLKLTIVLITHEMEVIKAICNRVAVLHQGEIIEQGTVQQLFTDPKSEMAKEFVKNSARLELPTALRRRLRATPAPHCNPILRLSFVGQVAQEPLIAYIIQQFGLTVNVIQAHLETIQDQTIGIMVIEIRGEETEIKKAMLFLEHKELHIEVLGYAPRTV
jgi:D-methionine transport system ATP-binding protein